MTVQDALNRSDLSLVISMDQIKKIAKEHDLKIANNRSLYVKRDGNKITEIYEFTGTFPVSSRELRKLL